MGNKKIGISVKAKNNRKLLFGIRDFNAFLFHGKQTLDYYLKKNPHLFLLEKYQIRTYFSIILPRVRTYTRKP